MDQYRLFPSPAEPRSVKCGTTGGELGARETAAALAEGLAIVHFVDRPNVYQCIDVHRALHM